MMLSLLSTVTTSKPGQLTITDEGKLKVYTIRYVTIIDTLLAGVKAVTILSQRVREVNIQTRLKADKEAWPPDPPKTFTPLVLIQHQGDRNITHSTAVTEFVERGHIDEVVSVTTTDTLPTRLKLDSHQPLQEVLDTSKVTKEVAEILAPLETSDNPQFILIEGAPGIGKTLLLREISYRWGKHQMLQKFKLVLLVCLRDPAVQQMSFIEDLFRLSCKRDEDASEVASACKKYFVSNSGDLAILFDGYDEYPERLRKDSLIAEILEREVLPHCGLIVSSRPNASVCLRGQATVRVDILGFTEAEREQYIKESMKDQQQKIDELTQYLQDHSTISSLCFVPFNIVVLVYLCKQGFSLPQTSAELYNYFICLTVRRHLTKHGRRSNITNLTDLPDPYNKIIQQLSKLSLEALNDDKLTFTSDEIKAACPDITAIPGAINGFGLLQAVEHSGLIETTTINFLHFSIQEYLAAHHITNLPADKELKIIEEKFWSAIHFNMFSIYIALTKGQRPSFKHFICGGNKSITISDKFLNDQLQSICLYRCFHEAGNVDICKTIERSVKFSDKEINLNGTRLTASDVKCVTVFLTSSFHKEWVRLNLYLCYIQDHGLHMLHRGLLHCSNITIDQLAMGFNGLTTQSSSLIRDITVKCKVKQLGIYGNETIGDNKQLYSILSSPSTELEVLWMYDTKLSTRGAIALFTALKNNIKLKKLSIAFNVITDDACEAITAGLEKNICLVKLYMYGNPLTGKAIVNIVNSLKVNNTLAVLGLPRCSEDIMKTISSLQKVINKNRKCRGCQMKLKIDYR